ncbi:MAG TPA: diguanylate cyclase [Gammaproteobacteria bacterium]|nr:diguanylate cyclase [Gammaproteobacteria bacterium]
MSEHLDLTLATAALQTAPFGVLILDRDKRVCWINGKAEEFLNVEGDRLVGQGRDALQGEDLDCLFEPKEVMSLPMGSGKRWLKCWHLPLRVEGEVVGEIYFYIDITEHRKVKAERDQLMDDLSRQSVRDPLTGLPNRRGLMQGLEPQVSRSRRYGNQLSVIRLQIDDIDQLDTRHGTSTTDRVIISLGQLLRDQTRWADIVGCYDMGEFLMVLPETNKGTAVRLAEKFCRWIREFKVTAADGREITVVGRCGVTQWVKGDDAAKMLRRALQALKYIKKSNDRFVSAL